MELLWEHTLDVEGIRVPASEPRKGDARSESSTGGAHDPQRVTVGVPYKDAVRLQDAVGKLGTLFDTQGHELLRFQVEKVDAAASLLTGVLKA